MGKRFVLGTLALSVGLGYLLFYGHGVAQDPPLGPGAKAWNAYDTGRKLYFAGRFDEATDYFLAADAYSPNSIVLLTAARAAIGAGNFTRAAEIALRYVALYSDDDIAQLPSHIRDQIPRIVCFYGPKKR